jgi:hypothetical protein
LPQPEHDNPLEVLITRMLRENIRYMDWAEFWYDDEPHQGQIALYDRNLRSVQSPRMHELSDTTAGVLWNLAHAYNRMSTSKYGHYRLDVVERTVTQLGRARYEVVMTPIADQDQEQRTIRPDRRRYLFHRPGYRSYRRGSGTGAEPGGGDTQIAWSLVGGQPIAGGGARPGRGGKPCSPCRDALRRPTSGLPCRPHPAR